MKARFVGDPRYRDDPRKANDPDRIVYHGKEFPKGEWVTIDDKKDELWIEKNADKLRGNSHFEVDSDPAAPGMEPYKPNAEYDKQRKAEQDSATARAEADESLPGHRPDTGPVRDVGSEDAGVTAPSIVPEAMTRGFGSVDSPTDVPSRNPEKKDNLMRDREVAAARTPVDTGKSKPVDTGKKK